MNQTQKVINAIENRTTRLEELHLTRTAVKIAERNLENATIEVARQIKNRYGFGRKIAFGESMYEARESSSKKLILSVTPIDFEVINPRT